MGEVGTVAMCRRIFKEQTSEHGEIPFYKIGTFGGPPDAFIARELFEEFKDKYPENYSSARNIINFPSDTSAQKKNLATRNELIDRFNTIKSLFKGLKILNE